VETNERHLLHNSVKGLGVWVPLEISQVAFPIISCVKSKNTFTVLFPRGSWRRSSQADNEAENYLRATNLIGSFYVVDHQEVKNSTSKTEIVGDFYWVELNIAGQLRFSLSGEKRFLRPVLLFIADFYVERSFGPTK